MAESGVIVLDVETTGFSPHRGDRIIEIGAVIIGLATLRVSSTLLSVCRGRFPAGLPR
jgi:oligoribonuclease (3'-5' exoribonuclease)